MSDVSGLRVGLYARVSSEQQAQARTVASQLEALREQIQADGLRLEEEMCFVDDGYSGSTLLRPALERLRDVAAAGGLERLYVHSPDRLARKYAYQVLLVDELRRSGVELVFLNRQIGATPEEDLLLQVQGMVAEYERAKILERSRRGKRHAARSGKVNVLSGAPYGYRYVSQQEGAGQASYRVVMDEARVVQQIFTWVGVERLSIGEVCRCLARQGIASPRGKSYWDRTTVWAILKNPAYQGLAAFGKTRIGERRSRLRPQRRQAAQPRRAYSSYDVPQADWIHIPVPAIVSAALFETVAEQLAENRVRNRQRRRGARYLLQGLLTCQVCGYAFYGKSVSRSSAKGKRRDYAYYRCIGADAYRFGGQRLCHNKQVRTDLLEAAVWQDVRALLSDPERIEREYQRRLTKKESASGAACNSVANSLQQIKRGIARLIDAYEDGLLERSEFEPRLRRAKERVTRLEGEAQVQAEREAEEQQLRLVIGRLHEFEQKLRAGLQDCDWTTRREIIRTLVKRVEIHEEAVRIVYKVNPSPFASGPEPGSMQYCWRRDHRSLRTPGRRSPRLQVLHNALRQEALDQSQHSTIADLRADQTHKPVVRESVEIAFEIDVCHLHVPRVQQRVHPPQGIFAPAPGPEPVAVLREVPLEDRLDHLP
jgi:site-specific DNA recombinase